MIEINGDYYPPRNDGGRAQILFFIILALILIIFFLVGLLWIKESLVDDVDALAERVEELEVEVEGIKGGKPAGLETGAGTSILPSTRVEPVTTSLVPGAETEDDLLFEDRTYKFRVEYPSSFRPRTFLGKGPVEGDYEWNAVSFENAQGVYAAMYVNPASSGTIYPNKIYALQEQNDGSIVIVSERAGEARPGAAPSPDILIIANIESRNGNRYFWLMSYPVLEDAEEDLRAIIEGTRLLE